MRLFDKIVNAYAETMKNERIEYAVKNERLFRGTTSH